MRRLKRFDILVAFFLLALTSVFFANVSKKDTSLDAEEYEITVTTDSKAALPDDFGICYIDGTHKAAYSFQEENAICFFAEGIKTERGIIFFGGKYISLNQPVKLSIGELRIKGRVTKISQI